MLLTLFATAQASADGDAGRGKTLFTRCSSCHAVTEQNKVGPHLSGVFGGTAGTVAGASYSKAMTASGMTWDEQTLDAFLTEPGLFRASRIRRSSSGAMGGLPSRFPSSLARRSSARTRLNSATTRASQDNAATTACEFDPVSCRCRCRQPQS
jgi:Cytochrome c